MDYPVKPEKKARKIEQRTVWLITSEGKLLLRRRANKGLLAGLWEFPNSLVGDEIELSLPYHEAKSCGTATHIFSHIEWHMEGKSLSLPRCIPVPKDWRWVSAEELQQEIALPSAFETFASVYLKQKI